MHDIGEHRGIEKKREEKKENEERGIHAWEMNGTAISGTACSRSRTRTRRRECFTFDERGRRFEYSNFEHCALRIEYHRVIRPRIGDRFRGDIESDIAGTIHCA